MYCAKIDAAKVLYENKLLTITEYDVYAALVTLGTTKATGQDKLLKGCANALYKPLYHLLSLSLKHGDIPSSWQIHKILRRC